MHILFLTDNFPPEVNAPASRTYEHAREWVRLGAKVTVITCAPNFPRGKVFPGYRNKLHSTEEMDGITVIRVWTYITANEGRYRRTLDYVSFMLSAFIASFGVRKVDIIIGTSPQFFNRDFRISGQPLPAPSLDIRAARSLASLNQGRWCGQGGSGARHARSDRIVSLPPRHPYHCAYRSIQSRALRARASSRKR